MMQLIEQITDSMRVKFALLFTLLCLGIGMVILVATPTPAGANIGSGACTNSAVAGSAICKSRNENVGGSFGASIVNTLLFLLGLTAVVMIIIGGVKYATADGDSSKISSAKNTILYSVVGLIVAIMAWGIVTFVINQVK